MSTSAEITPELAASAADDLAQRIGHVFVRPALLTEALTHSSAVAPPRGRGRRRAVQRHYERLEFLGDRVLGLVIADLLWHRFETEPEGPMTRRMADLVRRETVARVALEIGLDRHLVLSPAEAAAGAAKNPSILADVCEAVIAATYLDGGLPAANAFVRRWWEPLIDEKAAPPRDPKTRLQEWAQARGLGLPAYRLVITEGPDHAPRFTVAASVAQSEEVNATASSKRAAETEAAAGLLALLTHDG
ncbi:MAG: ribonuclease III [Stellaceae bacterium]